ncbi:TetR/AcrR family transcriptional regulator [Arsenicicoccus dermatophilus]|uniref:TetR/AcrR family transcriptional regulator n=1 Tax=Arsenicicoccus dermatophilus TaxID=1076331 RepID=UPI00391741A7
MKPSKDTPAAGGPDPLRLLQLLWSPATKMGRSGMTLDAVVERAVMLADADGIGALTMRRLADEVGVGAMTLYGYVPGKPELVELMIDRVAATTYAGREKPVELPDWRAAVRHIATCNYDHAVAHGWLGDVSPARPILGPGQLAKYEDELAPLDGIGLDDLAMDQALTHLLATTQYAARWHVAMDRARAESRLSDAQWWQTVGPRLSERLGDNDLPISSRVGQTLANAGDPPGFCSRAVETIISDLEERVTYNP